MWVILRLAQCNRTYNTVNTCFISDRKMCMIRVRKTASKEVEKPLTQFVIYKHV